MSITAKGIGIALLVPAVVCLASQFVGSASQPATEASGSDPSMCIPTSGFIGWLYGQDVPYGTHAGVDIWTENDQAGTPPGNPVYSAADGTLKHIYDDSSPFQEVPATDPGATTVVMEHSIGGETVYSWYVHMASDDTNDSYLNPALEKGEVYPKGTLLGYQGNRIVSGVGDPVVHLHFQVSMSHTTMLWGEGSHRDPSPFLGVDVNWPRPPESMTPVQSNCRGVQTLFTLDTPNPQASGTAFGRAVAVGEVNGDGKEDIAVGAEGEDVGGNGHPGRAYVFSGADGSLLFALDSPDPGYRSQFGFSLAVADVNGDGKADIAVGASGEDVGSNSDQGRAYVFSGADGSLLFTLDTPNPQARAYFGDSIAVGDVDGDGKGDIAVGADWEDVAGNTKQGRAYVFFGASGSLLLTLDTPNPQAYAYFGWSVAVGDVNGDGKADIAVGASGEDVGGGQGRAYVFSVVVRCDPGMDTDLDGFDDDVECYMGTDALDYCADDPSDDAWPPDIDMNTEVNILDILLYKPKLTGPYDARYDLDASGEVNILDVLLYKPLLNTSCTNP